MAASSYYNQVYTMFVGYFGRPPAQSGLDYYAGLMDASGGNYLIIVDDFYNSAESQAIFAGLSVEQQVNQVFQNLFSRDALPGGLNYWTNQVVTGAISLPEMAYTVAYNAAPADAAILDAKIDSAALWVVSLNTTEEILAYSSDAGHQAGRDFLDTVTTSTPATQAKVDAALVEMVNGGTAGGSYTLTVNQDIATAQTFDAPIFTSTQTGNQIQTLTSVDKLTGTAGTEDVLNAILTGTEVATKPTVSGVETINLTSIAASIFDGSNVTGMTKIASVDSASDLTIRGLTAATTVQVKNAAVGVDTLVQVANSVVSGTTDQVTLELANVGRGTTTANAVVINLRGETTGGFETVNVVSSGGASRLNDITSDSAAGLGVVGAAATASIRTLNVSGDSNLRIDNVLTNVTKVDANAFAGKLRVTLDTTKDMTVIGGKADDTLIFGTGLNTADTVNGGDGRDTISVTTNTALADGNKLSNVEILMNAGAAGATVFDMGKVASLDSIIHATGNAATYNNFSKAGAADAAKGINQSGAGAVTVNVKDAGALGSNSDVLNITVGSATQTATYIAGAITTSAVESIKVNVADASGNTATAAGAFLTTGAAVQSVVFTGGSAGIAFNSGAVAGSGVALTNIDGSAFIGNLTATGNLFSQVIKGGSGDDTLGTGGRAAFADGVASDALIGGNGQDTFVFATTDMNLTGANLTTAAASTADGLSELTAIGDLNFGGSNAATGVDKINLSAMPAAVTAITIVNAGAVQALSGANLGVAVNELVNAGTLLDATAANTAMGGLFSFGSDVFFIATSGLVVADTFGAVAGTDIIIKVTGVIGTMDATDFIM